MKKFNQENWLYCPTKSPVELKGWAISEIILINGRLNHTKSAGIGLVKVVIQQLDVQSRWQTILQDSFSDIIHNVAQLWPDEQSITISYRDLRNFDPDFAQSIIDNPEVHIDAANNALNQILRDEGYGNLNPMVRIIHLPKYQVRTVSTLRVDDIGKFLAIDAVVTKISAVRPRIYAATFECMSCGAANHIQQPNEQELIEPLECNTCEKTKSQTKFVLLEHESVLVNSQFIEIQELPEQMKGGLQPERIQCIAEHDLTGNLTPGERVKANGMLFMRAQRKNGKNTPVFDLFLRITSVERENIPFEEVQISEEDENFIKDLAKREDIADILIRSISPSIFGYKKIKESLLLQLFGGVRRVNSDKTTSRGDIHILLMGDPGVAKSQMLRYMSLISPRGRFTSGKSASAAGLTAAAVKDSIADGRWTLEAGTLVLADMGLAAIDEFDKMSENDRSSMHEAMEQQTISITKAGINATLKTRCAVLAAANPKAGRFETLSDVPFTAQVNLAPPLISRFDVIWVMTDNPIEEQDAKIAHHILETRGKGSIALHGDIDITFDEKNEKKQGDEMILDTELIKKYVAHAKRAIHPILEDDANQAIIDYYVQTRKKGGEAADSISITARALEAIVRLAEAHARIRLSPVATVEDAQAAITLTRFWREEIMGGEFDETTLHSGKKAKARDREKIIMDTIADLASSGGGQCKRIDVLNHLEKYNINRDTAEDIIDKLVESGRVFRPGGYETLALI